eukprot:m.301624 g.301624  ORF g.301624 m.301624 type:complete len:80 (+) comp40810_c0_seq37:4721-4960(+)
MVESIEALLGLSANADIANDAGEDVAVAEALRQATWSEAQSITLYTTSVDLLDSCCNTISIDILESDFSAVDCRQACVR